MSKQPYNIFLTDRLINWLEHKIQAGYRYRFYSDDSDQIKDILIALQEKKSGEINYLNISLPYINIADKKLVFVNDVEDIMNEHFISNLRDAISTPDKVFINCALLVLHQSRLDTLLNSAHDLATTDAPFNPKEVEKHLTQLCKETYKPILFKALLNIQTKQIKLENQSAFGYKGIYESIASNSVDFKSLNLFEDKDLDKYDTNDKVQKHIEKNQKLYSEIEYNLRNFSNELPERLPKYSPEFIAKHLTVDNWDSTSIQQLEKEIKKNSGEGISFISMESDTEATPWLRDENTTASGQRTKNIIMYTNKDDVSILLKFKGSGLTSENFSIMDNIDLAEHTPTYIHNKLNIQIPFSGQPLFFRVRLKTNKSSETHFFKFLILRESSFYLDNVKNHFIVKPDRQELLLKLSTLELNFAPAQNTNSYTVPPEVDEINVVQHPHLNIEQFYDAHDEVKVSITNGTDALTLLLENEKTEDKISIPLLFNIDKTELLFDNGNNAEYNQAKKKAILNNREFLLVGERITFIEYEHLFIINQAYMLENGNFRNYSELDKIDPGISSSLQKLLAYFIDNKTTPSLCAWNKQVCDLASVFVDNYITYVSSIEENQALTQDQKTIFELGFVRDKGKTFLSPFSPLILSYILHLVKSADDSYKDLFSVTLKRLNAKGLFPYLFIDNDTYAFTKVVEEDSFWFEFVPNEENEFSYISKLTSEKIREFKESFSALFDFRDDAPLIINSINNGRNEELFEGIVEFYKKSFKEPVKIIVNLYDEKFEETAFDKFADMDNNDSIKTKYRLKVDDVESIIDVMRTHITYSKHLTDEPQKYCHLSFFKNNEKVKIRNQNVLNKKSGLVHEGLISGESSEKKDENYYSGFGLKNINVSSLQHLKLAKIYNAMQRPVYESGTEYLQDNTISLMISDNFKALLEKSYKSALWTVIIDPKVTLDFFDNHQDLILIHYSDQYSSSANYDAITVTAKTDLYSNIVGSKEIISEFNAFNGEWLIKMITEQEKIQKEKNGIIAAYKYITALLSSPKITWVPLSVAEMVRVSGNVGLSMSEQDFTRYNAQKSDEALEGGPISDDVLLVGFCNDGVILYPVEVKSGSANMQKAIKQAKALKSYFYDHIFNGNSLKSKLLKGLFIRQVLMQVEKYELYNVFDPNYFAPLYAQREYLLNGDYPLVEFDDHSEGCVVAFLNVQLDTSISIKENILECKLPFDFQDTMLHTSFNDLNKQINNDEFGASKAHMLNNPSCTKAIDSSSENEENTYNTSNEFEKEEQLEKTPTDIVSDEPEAIIDVNENISETVTNEPMQIKFGKSTLNQENIIWYPTDTTKTLNTNTGIIGTMGTGKTQFTKSLIAQMMQNTHHNVDGSPIGILIFDYKGDYIKEDFTKPSGAKVLEPYHLPYNPLALFGDRALLPVHTTNLFKTTLAKAFGLGPVQQSNLNRIILEAYERRGISKGDRSTWTKPAPTINDIWDVYSNEEKVTYDSLYAALEKLMTFEVFEPNPEQTVSLYDLVKGITVINLSGYDPDIQNLIVAITLDIFYTQMHIKGSSKHVGDYRQITKMILVDEADNFMSQDFESLKKILKEGREFGVGTILSTQQLTHFKTSEDNYANYIQTWIVHQVSTIKAQDVTSLFNISNKSEAEGLMEQIRKLEKHFSIYVDGNKNMTKMRDLAFWELVNG